MSTIIRERISELRSVMAKNGIDAYIIPSSDAHLGEYVPEHWKAREWISGFNGSAGTVVVTQFKAGLWTDSRYFLQAAEQMAGTGIELYKTGLPDTPSYENFLAHELNDGDTVGLDGQTFSIAGVQAIERKLAGDNIRLETSLDLVGMVWSDRPPLPGHAIFELPTEICGQSIGEKLDAVNDYLHKVGADGLLLCALDEIAWMFNIRGNDIEYNPVAVAYAYISEKESVLFISPEKVTDEVAAHIKEEGIIIADYAKAAAYISSLPTDNCIFVDKNKTNAALFAAIPADCRIMDGITPVSHLKTVKNSTEIEGFKKALARDGIALTRFYIWLEAQLANGIRVTEMSASAKLSSLRAEQPLYISDSFHTICGYAAHGAIVHYSANEQTDAEIRPEGILLMDSGAQYLDGTTDITRTIALSAPSENMMKDFTRVLKGHISLAKSRFPAGTRGSQLDILARKAMWDAGINYLHGTGHGIGHCLNVHEGPQSIRMEENPVALQAGMVMSNEPGIYRTNEYGIRIENMMVVRDDSETEFGRFLSFETMTLCFIDTNLVISSMLSAREHAWLNKYQLMVYEKLSPFLTAEEQEWLRNKTKSI